MDDASITECFDKSWTPPRNTSGTTEITLSEVMMPCTSPHMASRKGGFVQIYREKLRAEVEGRPYTPPPPSSVKPVSRSGSSGSMSRSRSAGRAAAGNNDSWDEWGDGGKVRPPSWIRRHDEVSCSPRWSFPVY